MATFVFYHAHPDDEAIATGGTMYQATQRGHRVVLVVATNGELGEAPADLAAGETVAERRCEELKRSCEILGVHRLELLGYHDSGMSGDDANDDPECFWQSDVETVAEQLSQLLLAEQADVLVTYDPNGNYGHPDHIQVYRTGVAAAAKAGVERVYWATMNRDRIREQIAQAQAAEALLDEERRETAEADDFGMPGEIITHAIEVHDAVEIKRQSMAAHASQITDESFFLTMDTEAFKTAFGTEWYVAAHWRTAAGLAADDVTTPSPRPAELAGGQFHGDLLEP